MAGPRAMDLACLLRCTRLLKISLYSQKYGCQIFGLKSAIFIAVVRPEIWTPDFLPHDGNFHGHFEARNTQISFKISCLDRPFFIPQMIFHVLVSAFTICMHA